MPTVTTPSSDPLLETQVFWVRFRIQIIAALLAIIVGSAAYGGYVYFRNRREAAAAELLAKAKSPPDFQKVISDYDSAPAAASAYVMLAAEQRNRQQFGEANATLKTFVDKHPKHELVTTAKMAMAGNLESLGKPDEALEMYRRIPADYPNSFTAPLAMIAQVPLLKQKGQIDEARQVCEKVMTQYRESYAVSEATQYLRSLKPKANATPPVPVDVPPANAAPAAGTASPPSAPAPAAPPAPSP